MKKVLKKTLSLLLVLCMIVSMVAVMPLMASAEESEASPTIFYEDFSEVLASNSIANNNVGKLATLTGVDLQNATYPIVFMQRMMHPNFPENNPKGEVLLDGGNIHFTIDKEDAAATTATTGGYNWRRTFIDLDDGFTVDSSVKKDLIIEFDIQVNEVVYDAAQTDTYINRNILGAPYKYDATNGTFPAFTMTNTTATGNAANYGLIVQANRKTGTNSADKVGVALWGTGNSFPHNSTNSTSNTLGGNIGVFNKELGTTFHVTYVINPATTMDSTKTTGVVGSNFAKIESITISDGVHTGTMTATATQYDNTTHYYYTLKEKVVEDGVTYYKSADRIDGLSFVSLPGIDYSIDNVKAYYEGEITAPTAKIGNEDLNDKVFSVDNFEATITFDQPITDAELATISVSSGSLKAEFIDSTKKVVNVSVTDLESNGEYAVMVPTTALNNSASFPFKTGRFTASDNYIFVQDFADATIVNANTYTYDLSSSKPNLKTAEYDVAYGKRTTLVVPSISDGELRIDGSAGVVDTAGDLFRSYVTFDKDFKVDSSVTKDLYIEFDVTLNDFIFAKNSALEYRNMALGGTVYNYDQANNAFKAFEPVSNMIESTNVVNHALEFQGVKNATTGLVETVGLGIRGPVGNGSTIAKQTNAVLNSTNGSNAGVFLNKKGTKFHVTYKINPATTNLDTSSAGVTGSQFAKIESITFTDGNNVATMKACDTNWNDKNLFYTFKEKVVNGETTYYKSTDKLNGIAFTAYNGVDYSIDNVKVYYEGALGEATAKYNGENLEGAIVADDTAVVTVEFENPITEDELNITANNDAIVTVGNISEDGKSVNITISELSRLQSYTLNIGSTALNTEAHISFKTDKAPWYYFQAEFEGNDDTSTWYHWAGGAKYIIKNTNPLYVDGYLRENNSAHWNLDFVFAPYDTVSGTYKEVNSADADVYPVPDNALDFTGKENVIFEFAMKYTGSFDGLDKDFGAISFGEGDLFSVYADKDTGAIYYGRNNSSSGPTGGAKFSDEDGEFLMSTGYTYDFVAKADFVSHTYTLTITERETGRTATSPELFFTFNSTNNELKHIQAMRSGYLYLDYIRIADGDYGKVEVEYGDYNYPLDGSVLVGVNDVFVFNANMPDGAVSGITLNGNPVNAEIYGGVVIVTPGTMEYNTEYELFIPVGITEALESQSITFTTIYDETAVFDASEYDLDVDNNGELNAVYLGGSLTRMNGSYRETVSNFLTEKFSDTLTVNNINEGLGGTGAHTGWQRLAEDVIAHNPDIVFIEFAVNDSVNTNAKRDMESIVRNLLDNSKTGLVAAPKIVFIELEMQQIEKTMQTVEAHKDLAEAYGIPVVDTRAYVNTLINNNENGFAEDWYGDVYYPENDTTHSSIVGGFVGEYIVTMLEKEADEYFASTITIPTEALTDCRDYILHETELNNDENTVTFTFTGTEFSIEKQDRIAGGAYTVTIDGVAAESISTVSSTDPSVEYSQISTLNYEVGEGTHTVVITGTQALKDNILAVYTKNSPATIVVEDYMNDPVINIVDGVAKASVECITQAGKDFVIILAGYNGDVVETTEVYPAKSDASTEVQTITTPNGISTSGITKFRAFVWESINTAIPITFSK